MSIFQNIAEKLGVFKSKIPTISKESTVGKMVEKVEPLKSKINTAVEENPVFKTVSNFFNKPKPLQASLTPKGEDVVKKQAEIATSEGIVPEENSFVQNLNLVGRSSAIQAREKNNLPYEGYRPTKEETTQAFNNVALDIGSFVGSLEQVGAKEIIKNIAKSKNLTSITDDLMRSFKFDPKEAIDTAKKLVDISDEKQVASIIEEVVQLKPKPFNTREYIDSNISRRESERLGNKESLLTKGSNLFKKFKTAIADENAPIEDVLYDTLQKNKVSILPSQDIANNIDRVYRSNDIAVQFMKDNGLTDIAGQIKQLDGNFDDFGEYLLAKHSTDVNTRGFETGRDIAKDQQLVKELSPKYEQYAKNVKDYSNKLLDMTVESGLVPSKDAQKLKEIYPNYVPINRVFSELEKEVNMFNSGGGIGNVSKQTVVKKLEGSSRAIENPLESFLLKTVDTVNQVERNNTFKTMSSYEKLPGNPFNIRKINSPEDVSTGKTLFSGYRDGIKEIYEIDKNAGEAIKGLNTKSLSLIGKVLSIPTRILKVGTTALNPAFILRNVTRDQFTAFINSDKALRTSIANPKVWMKGFTESLGQGKLYDEFVRAGGGGTSFDVSREAPIKTLEALASKRSKGARIKYLAKNPKDFLRAIEDTIGQTSEIPTRMQQYIGTKEDLIAKGLPESEAVIAAARAGREATANFSRRGLYGKEIGAAIPYFGAGVQGSRAFIKAAKKNPTATAVKIAGSLLIPETMLTMWALSDDKRKEVWDSIPEYEKENNFIFIPPNPTQDEEGRWNVIKAPKPPGVSNIATMVRRPLEQMHGQDKVKFKEMFDAAVGTVSPITLEKSSLLSTLTPQLIKPSLESNANFNFFTGQPIVSSKYEKLSPELQVKPGTTYTSQVIGKATKSSPIKIDAFIRSTFGQAGFNTVNAIDNALAGFNVIPKEKVGGQSFGRAISESFTKARADESDSEINTKAKKMLQGMTDSRFVFKQEAEILYNELKALPKSEANKKMSELDKVNPNMVDKIYEIADEEKKGLTYDDRLIKQMGVEDGTRAKFIFEVAKGMEKSKANAYINDLDKKGIISDNVYEQLVILSRKSK